MCRFNVHFLDRSLQQWGQPHPTPQPQQPHTNRKHMLRPPPQLTNLHLQRTRSPRRPSTMSLQRPSTSPLVTKKKSHHDIKNSTPKMFTKCSLNNLTIPDHYRS